MCLPPCQAGLPCEPFKMLGYGQVMAGLLLMCLESRGLRQKQGPAVIYVVNEWILVNSEQKWIVGTVTCVVSCALFVGTVTYGNFLPWFCYPTQTLKSLRVEEGYPNSLLALPTARTATKMQKEVLGKEIIIYYVKSHLIVWGCSVALCICVDFRLVSAGKANII